MRYLAPPKFSAMVDLTVSTIAAILGALVCRLLGCDELIFLELNEEVKDMMSLEEHCLWRNLSRGVGLLSLSVIILQADDVTSSKQKAASFDRGKKRRFEGSKPWDFHLLITLLGMVTPTS